jgi:hypothetical protein
MSDAGQPNDGSAPTPADNLDLARLDRLKGLSVASPCPERWDQMQGDDKRRYCGRCRLDVYNLSAMTTAEAAALVEQHAGRLCVRFVRAHDGKVMTADCPHLGIRLRRRILVVASVIIGGLICAKIRSPRRGPGFVAQLRQFRPLRPIVDLIFGPPEIVGVRCAPPGFRPTSPSGGPSASPTASRLATATKLTP